MWLTSKHLSYQKRLISRVEGVSIAVRVVWTGRVLFSVYVWMPSVSWSFTGRKLQKRRACRCIDSWTVCVGGVSAHTTGRVLYNVYVRMPWPSRDQSPVANISITVCPSVSRLSTASIVRRACAITQFRLAGRPLTPSCRIIVTVTVSHLFLRSRVSRW